MKLSNRIIAVFSPKTATAREMAEYAGPGPYRTKIIHSIFNHFYKKLEETQGVQVIRNQTRNLYRNTGKGRGFIDSNITGTVGSGLRFRSEIDNDYLGIKNEEAVAYQKEIDRRFNNWARSKECSTDRNNNFFDLQTLAFKTVLLSGDCFITTPLEEIGDKVKLRLGVFEAEDLGGDQEILSQKNQGIIIKKGKAVGYEFHLDEGIKRINRWKTNGLPNCIHLFKQDRPGQIRGIPYLAPVLNDFYNLAKYTEAEIIGAMLTSMFSVFIKNENETGLGDEEEKSYQLKPGMIQELALGQSIELAESRRPNKNYKDFIGEVSSEMAAALGQSGEVVRKKFEQNYSASRAAIIFAFELYKINRSFLINNLLTEILMVWMWAEVRFNGLDLPGFIEDEDKRKAYMGCRWIGSAIPSIDPYKEARAIKERADMGLTTLTEESQQYNGGDFRRNIETIGEEIELKQKYGLQNSDSQTEEALIKE